MGRNHTFMDREFRRRDYDSDDRGTFESGLVFVIMPFVSDDSKSIYAAIKEECSRLELKATRVDEGHGSGFIISEITSLIEEAEFIICDLSYERPNVYYELGYAHGVGNEADDLLLVAKAGTKLHFDVAPLRVHYFEDEEALRGIVRQQLSKMIEVTRA
jgi:hypothetical protein